MKLGLDGKIVLITGGSKGIGLACARAFAHEGARVAIASRSQDNLDRARQVLSKEGVDVIAQRADFSDGWRHGADHLKESAPLMFLIGLRYTHARDRQP
jgi:NAD(P)-dependent dehydrogenase (short-subunit alcohol dehydrogenase family)